MIFPLAVTGSLVVVNLPPSFSPSLPYFRIIVSGLMALWSLIVTGPRHDIPAQNLSKRTSITPLVQ